MTPKQERFCEEYLVDLNATQAAIRAGYSKNGARQTAHHLLSNPDIENRVVELREAASERTEITIDSILTDLNEVKRRCMQAEPVLDRKGEPVCVETPNGDLAPAYTFQANGANKALELLGKHFGAFPNQVNVSGEIIHTHVGIAALPEPVADEAEWAEVVELKQVAAGGE